MGGSDPAGFTTRAVSALSHLGGHRPEIRVVLGSGFSRDAALQDVLHGLPPVARSEVEVLRHQSARAMQKLMADADLAVASFGVTAYELAALGVPAVYLCLTEDHATSASAFVDAGIAVSLGIPTERSEAELATEVRRLLEDDARRREMSARAARLVDGRGTVRVAQTIIQSMTGR
jgi:spore coat polysaccharide biosynthesis protein SpsF